MTAVPRLQAWALLPSRLTRTSHPLPLSALLAVAMFAGSLVAGEAPSPSPSPTPAPPSPPAAAPALDPATAKAADQAADAYLASQEPQLPASQDGQNAIADAEVDLLEVHNLVASHLADHASTPYLAASKKLNAITAEDRHRLGARFRKDLDELLELSQQLLGTSAVDPASHPPTTPAEAKAAEPAAAPVSPPAASTPGAAPPPTAAPAAPVQQ